MAMLAERPFDASVDAAVDRAGWFVLSGQVNGKGGREKLFWAGESRAGTDWPLEVAGPAEASFTAS